MSDAYVLLMLSMRTIRAMAPVVREIRGETTAHTYVRWWLSDKRVRAGRAAANHFEILYVESGMPPVTWL